jgi:hypothetical protein
LDNSLEKSKRLGLEVDVPQKFKHGLEIELQKESLRGLVFKTKNIFLATKQRQLKRLPNNHEECEAMLSYWLECTRERGKCLKISIFYRLERINFESVND